MKKLYTTYKATDNIDLKRCSTFEKISMLINHLIDNSVLFNNTSQVEEQMEKMKLPIKIKDYTNSLQYNIKIKGERFTFRIISKDKEVFEIAANKPIFADYIIKEVPIDKDLEKLGAVDYLFYEISRKKV